MRGRRGLAPHLSLGRTLVLLDLSAIGAGQGRRISPLTAGCGRPGPFPPLYVPFLRKTKEGE